MGSILGEYDPECGPGSDHFSDFEAARPDFEAARPDFEAAWPQFPTARPYQTYLVITSVGHISRISPDCIHTKGSLGHPATPVKMFQTATATAIAAAAGVVTVAVALAF